MATKFYFQSTASSPITPAVSASWDFSIASFARYPTSTTKAGQTLQFISLNGNGDSADTNYCFGQWISYPLAAQTIIAQQVRIQMRCMEEAARCNQFLTATVRVLSSDGGTVRGTICSLTRDNTEMVATTTESLATNRAWAVATSTQVVAQEGDVIVIEVGSGGDPSTGAGGNSHDSDICVGDASATDLTLDNDMEVANNNPYCLFDEDIDFYVAGTDASDTRDGRTHGSDVDSDTRDGRTHGSDTDDDTRDGRTAGVDIHVIDYWPDDKGVALTLVQGAGISKEAQSYESDFLFELDKVVLRLKRVGTPDGTAYVKIYDHSGVMGTSSVPTGTALATSDPFDPSTLELSIASVEFEFSGDERIDQDPDTKYCIALEYDGGDSSNYIAMHADNADYSHPGNAAMWIGSWMAQATMDLCFFVYGNRKYDADNTRDGRTYGSDVSDDVRDGRTHGSDVASDTRDGRTEGVSAGTIVSDTRDGRTHGSDVDSDTRDGRTEGVAQVVSDERDGRTHGSDVDDDTRDARTHGSDIDDDTRDGRTHGSDTDDDTRDGRTEGSAQLDSDTRDGRTHGSDVDDDTRDGRTHGSDVGSSTRDGRTLGYDAGTIVSDTRDGRTQGAAQVVSVERDGRTHGSDVDDVTRDGRTHGSDTESSTRDGRTLGVQTGTVVSETRDGRTHGADLVDDERDGRTHGSEVASDTRDGRTYGVEVGSTTRDGRTHGADTVSTTRDGRTEGSGAGIPISSTRDGFVLGTVGYGSSTRDGRVVGIGIVSVERDGRTWGSDTESDTRDGRTYGVLVSSSTRDGRTAGLYIDVPDYWVTIELPNDLTTTTLLNIQQDVVAIYDVSQTISEIITVQQSINRVLLK